MATQHRRAAVFDGRHHLELPEANVAGVGPTPCRAVIPEDIRDLQCLPRHDGRDQAGGRGPWLSCSNGLLTDRRVVDAT